jgi:hypothetical protein
MAASAKARLPTKSQCARRVIDPLSGEIFADGQIAACQFLQRADACSAVIDRVELVHVQPVGQLACIDPVILVSLSDILPRIVHHQLRNVRLQQVL